MKNEISEAGGQKSEAGGQKSGVGWRTERMRLRLQD